MRRKYNCRPTDHLIYRFAETAGEGTGEGDGTDDTFDPKAFATSTSATIAALQKEIASAKKGHTTTAAELKSMKDTLTALTESIQALKPQTTESNDDVEDGKEGDTKDQKTTRTTKAQKVEESPEISAMKTQLAALQKQLDAEKKRSDAAEQRTQAAETRRRNGDRDRLLIATATDLEAISATDAADFLRHRAVYDEDTDSWGIKDGDDVLDMEEGVKKFLPKYMIKAKTTRGGAGGHSTTEGNNNGASKQQLLNNAVAKYKLAQKNSNGGVAYSKARADYEAAGGNVEDILTAIQE